MEHQSGDSSGSANGGLQGTHCPGDTRAGPGCPGQSLEHNTEDMGSTAPARVAAGPAPRGSIPVPGITFCLAPDPTTPVTAPQSLQGPSGPPAVTEMQIRGCGFKNVIKLCSVLKSICKLAGELVPRAAKSATTWLPRQCSRPFSIPESPQRGWGSLELLPEHFGVVISGASGPMSGAVSEEMSGGAAAAESWDPPVHPVSSDAAAEPTREESWLLTRPGAPCWHCR